jgi:uncharacterized protein (DUF2267 family)
MEKRDAYKGLRAVLQTVRVRLPLDLAVHFGAQLPMLVRGLYYEGWEPSKVPIKMSRQEFVDAVQQKIVAGCVIDPLETAQSVLSVVGSYVGAGEMTKSCIVSLTICSRYFRRSPRQHKAARLAAWNELSQTESKRGGYSRRSSRNMQIATT